MTPSRDTLIESEPLAVGESELLSQRQTEFTLLDLTDLLVQHKRFITRFVIIAIALAIVVALILPVEYEGNVALMPPAQHSSLGAALMGQMGAMGSLASLVTGGGVSIKNPADMYVALLTSRSVEDAMIHRFGLMSEYHTKRMSDTRKALERCTKVIAGSKDGLIRVTVEDPNPKRAAEMANGYVEEFRKLSASLAITEAARRRLFFQEELDQTKSKLTAAEEAMRKTQQSTGVLQIDSQARALIETAAVLRAQVVAKEVEIQGMKAFAADDNPQLVLAKQQLAALQSHLEQIAGSKDDSGSDIVLSKGRVTEQGMEYLRKLRDLKYQETVYELLAKELEIAKLDEAREGEIVQIVDPAVVPDTKSSPHRTLLVVGTALLAFFFAAFFVVVRDVLNRMFAVPENRQKLAAIREHWKKRPASA